MKFRNYRGIRIKESISKRKVNEKLSITTYTDGMHNPFDNVLFKERHYNISSEEYGIKCELRFIYRSDDLKFTSIRLEDKGSSSLDSYNYVKNIVNNYFNINLEESTVYPNEWKYSSKIEGKMTPTQDQIYHIVVGFNRSDSEFKSYLSSSIKNSGLLKISESTKLNEGFLSQFEKYDDELYTLEDGEYYYELSIDTDNGKYYATITSHSDYGKRPEFQKFSMSFDTKEDLLNYLDSSNYELDLPLRDFSDWDILGYI